MRREILTKQLANALGEIFSEKQFFSRRAEGIAFVDRRPLVQVHVSSPSEAHLSWKHTKRIGLGLDQATVESKFVDICKERGGEPWS